MPTTPDLLADISQLDKLNKEVLTDALRAGEILGRVKSTSEAISPPSQNNANKPESKTTETLPPLNQTGQ